MGYLGAWVENRLNETETVNGKLRQKYTLEKLSSDEPAASDTFNRMLSFFGGMTAVVPDPAKEGQAHG